MARTGCANMAETVLDGRVSGRDWVCLYGKASPGWKGGSANEKGVEGGSDPRCAYMAKPVMR